MKLLNTKQVIFELKNMKNVRIIVSNNLPYPATSKDLKKLISMWHHTAYNQILKIAKESNMQSRKVIINTVNLFKNKIHTNGYFYSHIGFKELGITSLFNSCIKNIKHANNSQKTVSSNKIDA